MYDLPDIPKRYLIYITLLWIVVMPISPQVERLEEEGIYTLYNEDISLKVSSLKGARVVSFTYRGEELLIQDDVHPKYYGATLWASPQRDYWPPSPVLDEFSYRVETIGDKIRFISQSDSITGLRFIKEFRLCSDSAIQVTYLITNISDKEVRVAPWDVTRVKGGITIFPLKDSALPDLSSDLEYTSIENDILWYTYSPDTIKKGQKLFATTREGWLAHLSGNLLLIKQFPMIEYADLPPLQGEVEIFVAPKGKYVELENHGKYQPLKPGETLEYGQKWYLFFLESDRYRNNRKKLVEFIKGKIEDKEQR